MVLPPDGLSKELIWTCYGKGLGLMPLTSIVTSLTALYESNTQSL